MNATRQLRGPHERSRWPAARTGRAGPPPTMTVPATRERLLEAARGVGVVPHVVAGAGAEPIGRRRRVEVERQRRECPASGPDTRAGDTVEAEACAGSGASGTPSEAQAPPVVRECRR